MRTLLLAFPSFECGDDHGIGSTLFIFLTHQFGEHYHRLSPSFPCLLASGRTFTFLPILCEIRRDKPFKLLLLGDREQTLNQVRS